MFARSGNFSAFFFHQWSEPVFEAMEKDAMFTFTLKLWAEVCFLNEISYSIFADIMNWFWSFWDHCSPHEDHLYVWLSLSCHMTEKTVAVAPPRPNIFNIQNMTGMLKLLNKTGMWAWKEEGEVRQCCPCHFPYSVLFWGRKCMTLAK